MVRGFLPKAIKGLLILTNNLVILMGIVVLGFGIFALTDGKQMTELVEHGSAASGTSISIQLFNTASIVLIVVGSIAVVVAFLGCCGAIKENRLILFIYYILILILFVGVIIGATIAFTQSIYVIRKPLQDSMPLYDPESQDNKKIEVTRGWDDVQKTYRCCGVDDFRDWTGVNGTIFPVNGTGYLVPESCCESVTSSLVGGSVEDCMFNPGDAMYARNMQGCLTQFDQTIQHNRNTITTVTAIIILFMFVNLVTMFCFALFLHPQDGYNMV